MEKPHLKVASSAENSSTKCPADAKNPKNSH
jgi:hypothetical protein